MKSVFKIALFSCLLLVPGFLSAKTFEGTVKMTMSDSRGETHHISYCVKDSMIRTEMSGEQGVNAAAIIDTDKQLITVLMPAQSMYMTMPMKQTMDKVSSGHVSSETPLENTGITKLILGYECTKYLSQRRDGATEIWATTELGSFMGLGGGMQGPMGGKKPTPAWEQAIAGKDFFPLLVIGHGERQNKFTLTTTSVERQSLSDSVFEAPEGYRKFDMRAMMQGMGGAMFGQ